MELWNAIYADLERLLSGLPFAKAKGSPTYLIVDYGDGQHKIECEEAEYFDPAVLRTIQDVLRRHALEWEVILVGGPRLGPQQAISVFPDKTVVRWSNVHWYSDDA